MAETAPPTKKPKHSPNNNDEKKGRNGLAMVDGTQLNSGYRIPWLGLGTWKSGKTDVGNAVVSAIKTGYRHIDCAPIYGNEKEIGEALRQVCKEGIVSREELFITSKVFNNFHLDRVPLSCNQTLKDLQLDYIDLLLVHWPIMFEDADIPQPVRQSDGTPNPKLAIKFEFKDTWRHMEKLLSTGLVKSIGVSNFSIEHLTELKKISAVIPAVNQIEFHPLLTQQPLLEYCQKEGIVVTAYSPLGSGDSHKGSRTDTPKLLKDKCIVSVAEKYSKTPAQVLLRWSIQKGVCVIPKSINASRQSENANIFDFELTLKEMQELDSLNQDYRFGLGWLPGYYLPISHTDIGK